MSASSPAQQAAPGVIVRIRLSGITQLYASKRMRRDEAVKVAHDVREALRAPGLVVLDCFPSADLEELTVKADQVRAVEVRCSNADGSLIPAAGEPTA